MNELLLLASIILAIILTSQLSLGLAPKLLIGIAAVMVIYAFLLELFSAALGFFRSLFSPPVLIPLIVVGIATGGYLWYRNRNNRRPFNPY